MSLYGLGTSIVECLRIGRMIERHGEAFLTRVFSAAEIRHCQERQHSIQQYAALWAGKEATLRACSMTKPRDIRWTELEISFDRGARPYVRFHGGAKEIIQQALPSEVELAIAHCRAYATATAMILHDDEIPF